MISWISGLLDRMFSVLGALLFFQLPIFMQQYTYRLSGHVAELKVQVEALRKAAEQTNKTLEEYIRKFITNDDLDFFHQGEIMQGMVQRFKELSSSLNHLETTGILAKPFVFLMNLDKDVAQTTLASFQPGIPLNWEGGLYALLGMVIGFGLFSFIKGAMRLCTYPFRRKPRTQ